MQLQLQRFYEHSSNRMVTKRVFRKVSPQEFGMHYLLPQPQLHFKCTENKTCSHEKISGFVHGLQAKRPTTFRKALLPCPAGPGKGRTHRGHPLRKTCFQSLEFEQHSLLVSERYQLMILGDPY